MECAVCLEAYRDSDQWVPRVLACGHTLCSGCVCRILSASIVRCPLCTSETKTDSVQGLPINYALICGDALPKDDWVDLGSETCDDQPEVNVKLEVAIQPRGPQSRSARQLNNLKSRVSSLGGGAKTMLSGVAQAAAVAFNPLSYSRQGHLGVRAGTSSLEPASPVAGFHRQWCLLDAGNLFIAESEFSSARGEPAHTKIVLPDVEAFSALHTMDTGHPHCFSIRTQGREFQFRASSQQECAAWLSDLQRVAIPLRARRTAASSASSVAGIVMTGGRIAGATAAAAFGYGAGSEVGHATGRKISEHLYR